MTVLEISFEKCIALDQLCLFSDFHPMRTTLPISHKDGFPPQFILAQVGAGMTS